MDFYRRRMKRTNRQFTPEADYALQTMQQMLAELDDEIPAIYGPTPIHLFLFASMAAIVTGGLLWVTGR